MASKRIFLLDKSGSMESQLDDTIGGFNAFVREQIPLGGDLSLYTFSDDVKCEYSDKSIEEVPLLTKETYVPGGSTALFDAMGYILKKHKHQGTFVVMTDGYENASRKYTKSHVKDLIETSKLDVIYVGADIDQANEVGISNTMFYDGSNTPNILKNVSESVASNVLKLRKSQTP